MNTFDVFVPQMGKMLANLGRWLDEGVAHAEARGYDPELLLEARLAPDQYPLLRQIQSACDAAKLATARLADKEAPVDPDEEKTLEEIRARLAKTIAYLESFEASDLEGGEARMLKLGFLPEDKRMRGDEYLIEFAIPNFYFHVNHAYAILRSGGVKLGKRPYIGGFTLHDA